MRRPLQSLISASQGRLRFEETRSVSLREKRKRKEAYAALRLRRNRRQFYEKTVSPPLDIATRLEKWSQSSNTAGSLPDLAITKTIDEVIVYHSDGLHVGINDRRTNETESAMLEVPAECIGFG